jgi:hypothetical protein
LVRREKCEEMDFVKKPAEVKMILKRRTTLQPTFGILLYRVGFLVLFMDFVYKYSPFLFQNDLTRLNK